MSESIERMLEFAQGPLFRFSFALMILGAVRWVMVSALRASGEYLTAREKSSFWAKVRLRVLWNTFPSVVMRRENPGVRPTTYAYHLALCVLSLVFRFTAIVVPAFMVEHVMLWDRSLGLSARGFPVSRITLPSAIADVLSILAIVVGLALFLGRLYSPILRRMEPPWAFLKPLILVLPFATGVLAMHPQYSPFSYHVVMLIHVVSAAAVFVMIPFGRMLSCVHTPLTQVVPAAAWGEPMRGEATSSAALAK